MSKDNKKNAPKKELSKEAQQEMADAKVRFICRGLYGFGCGTDPKEISHWRKEKTWEEARDSFQRRKGD
ncbi:MAG: hypothetical protein J6P93_01870 [Alphaproteobacteria bacterium]|nr:hypothetical protein [Alphaproteobacteria bacterium]